MSERIRSDAVTDLAAYRKMQIRKSHNPPQAKTILPDKILDEISYHLLMAARAIASVTQK